MAKNKAARDGEQPAKKSGALTNPIRNLTIAAAVCLVLGVAFLARPHFIHDYCGYAIGGLICAMGVAYILIYFIRKPVSGVYRSEFATGTVLLAAGVWVITASIRPGTIGISITLRLIVTIIGVVIAGDGVLKLQYTLDLARMKFSAWWVGLITSLLGIALGVLTAIGLVDSFGVLMGVSRDNFINAMQFLGIGFCLNALLDTVTVILVVVRNHTAARIDAALAKQAEDMAKAAAAPAPAAAPYYAPAPASPVTPPTAPVAPPATPATPPAAPGSGEQS